MPPPDPGSTAYRLDDIRKIIAQPGARAPGTAPILGLGAYDCLAGELYREAKLAVQGALTARLSDLSRAMAVRLHRCPVMFAKARGTRAGRSRARSTRQASTTRSSRSRFSRWNRKAYKEATGVSVLPALEFEDGTFLREESSGLTDQGRPAPPPRADESAPPRADVLALERAAATISRMGGIVQIPEPELNVFGDIGAVGLVHRLAVHAQAALDQLRSSVIWHARNRVKSSSKSSYGDSTTW